MSDQFIWGMLTYAWLHLLVMAYVWAFRAAQKKDKPCPK